jgi:hypothetical protein
MQGQLLSVLVKVMRARRVLEIGTLGGYASICSLVLLAIYLSYSQQPTINSQAGQRQG